MASDIPFNQRVSCTVAEAAQASGLGRTTIYEMIGEGRLRTRKFGARTLIMVDSLLAAIEAAPRSIAERTSAAV
jgi:excisionase family DNA binding protein